MRSGKLTSSDLHIRETSARHFVFKRKGEIFRVRSEVISVNPSELFALQSPRYYNKTELPQNLVSTIISITH